MSCTAVRWNGRRSPHNGCRTSPTSRTPISARTDCYWAHTRRINPVNTYNSRKSPCRTRRRESRRRPTRKRTSWADTTQPRNKFSSRLCKRFCIRARSTRRGTSRKTRTSSPRGHRTATCTCGIGLSTRPCRVTCRRRRLYFADMTRRVSHWSGVLKSKGSCSRALRSVAVRVQSPSPR